MLFSQFGRNPLKAFVLAVVLVWRALISSVFYCNNKYRFFFIQSPSDMSRFDNLR